MLGQRRGRWPNIEPALVHRFEFAGVEYELSISLNGSSFCRIGEEGMFQSWEYVFLDDKIHNVNHEYKCHFSGDSDNIIETVNLSSTFSFIILILAAVWQIRSVTFIVLAKKYERGCIRIQVCNSFLSLDL